MEWKVEVIRPVLTEEEREIRMKKIHDAAAALILATMENKARLAAERERQAAAGTGDS